MDETGPATAARQPMIQVEEAERRFSAEAGAFDLSFDVPAGTIFGLIGPSGCGKTTTVRLLTGLYKPDKGRVLVLGHPPSEFSPAMRERLGYMPQQFVLYPNLSVGENLNFVASLYGLGWLSRRKRLREALEFVELADVRGRLGSQLSGGMQRRLQLACMMVHTPLLLFADEPTAGIDPVLREKFWDSFRRLRDQGRTLFVTTQYVGEAAHCDLVGVMREGRMVHLDTPDNLRKKALGGEVIKLVVDPARTLDALQIAERHPDVHDARRSRSEPGLIYLDVADAAGMLPVIINLLKEPHAITVRQAEPYAPAFDDVFVQLMEQADH